MQRRKFVQQSILAGASVIAASNVKAATGNTADKPSSADPFHLNYAIHDGMFVNSAGKDVLDQIQFAYDNGFRAMEDNGMTSRPVDQQTKIGEKMAKLGMTMGVFVLDKGGNGANSLATGKPEYVDIFLKGCRQAVEVAKRVNAKWTTVVPGDFERHLSIGLQTANVITALRRGAEIMEQNNLIMVLEALSDTPDLFLRSSDQTYEICKAVNSPSCKILFDIYHMQKNDGNIINRMNDAWDEIAYIQIGDNPGRQEPTTGEINYKNIFKFVNSKGYKGVLGMEHGISKPGKEGEQRLIQAYRECDDFMPA
jgi:hydroxypyruvate isomerase